MLSDIVQAYYRISTVFVKLNLRLFVGTLPTNVGFVLYKWINISVPYAIHNSTKFMTSDIIKKLQSDMTDRQAKDRQAATLATTLCPEKKWTPK